LLFGVKTLSVQPNRKIVMLSNNKAVFFGQFVIEPDGLAANVHKMVTTKPEARLFSGAMTANR
jgi:hypothetical protein